jgi:uncharacterized membrane protein YeaQ/YmgE (transglycosylase-associated protein family)
MGLLWAIIIGFFGGLLARWLTPGRYRAGIIVTTLLGMVGAVLASLLGQWIGWYAPGEGAGLLGAVIGASTLLLLLRAFGPVRG